MADSGFQAVEVDPEIPSDGVVPFQFEVSWRSLTQPEIDHPTPSSDAATKPPEKERPPESENFKPPFADYLKSLTPTGVSLLGQVRPWARWVLVATMGLAIAAYTLS